MGNFRIFHDFRPLGVCANQDPDPPPRVGRGPASGRHTEGPFSRGVAAVHRARQVWGCREGARGSTEEPKRPLLLGMVAASGWGGRSGALATVWTPAPLQKCRVCTNVQRRMGPGAWRGRRAEGQAGTRTPARQVAHEVWVCSQDGNGWLSHGTVLSYSQGCLEGPGGGPEQGEKGVWTHSRQRKTLSHSWSTKAELGP